MAYPKIFTSIWVCLLFSMNGLISVLSQPDDAWQKIQQDLQTMAEDSAKVERYIDAGYHCKNFIGDSVAFYADLGIRLAERLGYQRGVVSGWVLKGSFANSQNRFAEAKRFYRTALEHVGDDQMREAQVMDNLANVFMKEAKYDSSLQIKLEALEVFKQIRDSMSLAIAYAGIGSVYYQKGDFQKSVVYAQQGLQYDTSPQRALTIGNIAAAKKNLGELDSAIYYYRIAASLYPEYPAFSGRNFTNIALLYLERENFDSADHYLDIAESNFAQLKDTFALARNDLSRARICLKRDAIQRGIEYCLGAKEIILDRGTIRDQAQYYGLISELYARDGAYDDAWQNGRSYRSLQDSISNLDLNTRVAEIEIKYATSEKEKMILAQELQLQKKSMRSRKLSYAIIALVVIGFSSIYLLIQRSRIQRYKEKQLAFQKERQIDELKSKNRLMAMNAMVKGQEEERMRIAKDLHDGLGGLLSTVKIRFLTLQNDLQVLRSHQNYHKVTDMLDTACDEVRRIAHNMMPDVLSQFGLPATIEDLGESLEKKGLNVHIELINVAERLPEELEINIYRIIQELINNMLKYAQAQKVLIQLSSQEDEIHLTVEDDGIGFDPTKEVNGIGLKNIYSRVAFLSGEVDIHSMPGEGTSVSIEIPLRK